MIQRSLIAFLLATVVSLGMPLIAAASQMEADMMCNPGKMECGCMMIMKDGKCIAGANKWQCPCYDTTNGFTTPGICAFPGKCQALSAPGQKGGIALDQGMSKLGEMLSQMMQKLMQSGSGSGSTPTPTPSPTSQCPTPQPTNIQALAQQNPCYYYQ